MKSRLYHAMDEFHVTAASSKHEHELRSPSILYTAKKLYHPTYNDNLNNNCPIPVILGTGITE